MDQIKSNIKAVVGSSKYGIPLFSLEHEYKNITNSTLNYRNYNFTDLKSFLLSINDVVRLVQHSDGLVVHLVTTEDDPQSLMKLRNLIQNTKIKKGSKGNQNIPQNIIGRPNNFNLKISVTNDLYPNDRTTYPSAHYYDNQRNNNFNMKQSDVNPQPFRNLNNVPKTNGFNVNNTLANQSRPDQPMTPSQFKHPIKYGFDSNTNSSSQTAETNHSENYTICPVNIVASKVKQEPIPVGNNDDQSNSPESVINWPIQMEIRVDVLHKRVKVLGVQAGYALVTVMDSMKPSSYIECKSFDTGIPGDFLLWQPPIPDSARSKTAIDTSTAFPVILINRLSTSILHVRLLGLKVLMDVDVENTFEFPKNAMNAQEFIDAFQKREAILVQMACICPFVNIWESPALNEAYFAPICMDDGRFIFERCDKRGDFLNVMLLVFYSTNVISKQVVSKKPMFIGNLISQMDKAMKAFQPSYQDMLDNKHREANQDSDVLLPIFSRSDCQNQMLIGCFNFMDMYSGRSNSDINTRDLVLYRIVYNNHNNTFSLFDSDSSKIIADWSNVPIPGVYVLNERFVNCRLSHMSRLRFQAAMLLHIQDSNTLRTI